MTHMCNNQSSCTSCFLDQPVHCSFVSKCSMFAWIGSQGIGRVHGHDNYVLFQKLLSCH